MSNKVNRFGQTYTQWMHAVDSHIQSLASVTSDDLADQNYMDNFEDDMSAKDQAIEALEADGFDIDDYDC